MSATRKASLAVVCILLTAVSACSRRHENQDFLPSAPATQNALQITNVGQLSVPADGQSSVRIEAQISPDANVARTIRFQTTLGGWLETGAAAASAKLTGVVPAAARQGAGGQPGVRRDDLPQEVFKEADTSGRAAAFLRSTATEGTAVVTVAVVVRDASNNVTDVLASVTREVEFVQVTDALTLGISSAEAFADGETAIELTAQISADSPAAWQTIVFSTNLGSFGGTSTQDLTVTADGNRVALARLVSDTEGTATVTAKIEEFDTASVTRLVTFTPAPAAEISVTPGSWNAGEVNLGSTAQQNFTIGNHGNSPLEVTSIAIDTANMGFSVQIPTIPITIEPGQFDVVTVSFAPATEGEKSANLDIESNDPDTSLAMISVPLTGKGVAVPDISVDGSLAFGSISKDTTSTQVLTIRNVGSKDLEVSDLTITGASEFTFLPATTDFTVAPSGSWDLSVTFDPASVAGDYSATLTIESDDPDEAVQAVALTGTATP